VNDGRLTIVVVDDHRLFSRGLELLLNSTSDGRVQVTGRTENAKDALELVRRHRPDVAVMDLSMPPPGGVAAIREVKHHYPAVRVLALSGTDDVRLALEALAAGADGFMANSSDPEVLVPPLQVLGSGLSLLPPSLLSVLVDAMARPGRAALERLSDEERALWRDVAKGLESVEIAERLFVSERTAKRMVASLLRKIGAANRVEAAALAGRSGLLDEIPDTSTV
jgi:two-component system, NarL family, nitrate/nitrite response regulator NarL